MGFQQVHTVLYTFGGHSVKVLAPERREVANWYEFSRNELDKKPDPYWTQVWPSALGLCQFLAENIKLIQGKNVLELAAGLGLPGLWAAHLAESVVCSDYLPEAVAMIGQSRELNGICNMECCVIDWSSLPQNLEAEVLLLSDINYEPAQFEQLSIVIERFLKSGTTIVLSTPQRLVAKPFIERLLPFARHQLQVDVIHSEKQVSISILVL